MSEYVSLKQLAADLKMDKSNLRKIIIAGGYGYVKKRMPDSKNQVAMAFTKEVADQIKKQREENGFGANPKVVDDGIGFFYIIQIAPDLDPNRVKLGYAKNVGQRLQQHRTTSPTAKLVKYWPCKTTWEQAAIDCITQMGCRSVGGEVFDCSNVLSLTEAGEEFFSVMPSPTHYVSDWLPPLQEFPYEEK